MSPEYESQKEYKGPTSKRRLLFHWDLLSSNSSSSTWLWAREKLQKYLGYCWHHCNRSQNAHKVRQKLPLGNGDYGGSSSLHSSSRKDWRMSVYKTDRNFPSSQKKSKRVNKASSVQRRTFRRETKSFQKCLQLIKQLAKSQATVMKEAPIWFHFLS